MTPSRRTAASNPPTRQTGASPYDAVVAHRKHGHNEQKSRREVVAEGDREGRLPAACDGQAAVRRNGEVR